MKIENDKEWIKFIFKGRKILKIDKKRRLIEYWESIIPFDDVRGYWKNYHPKGRGFVFYVMLLTEKRLHRITPEIAEEDSIEKVLDTLKNIIPVEVKG